MRAFGALSQQGWRRTGTINVILASVCEVVLLVCFILSLSNRETSSLSSTQMFEGSCERASTLNTIIHLSINIVSTGILASSNFFMQIVTSPSRKEINHSHSFLRPLKIGLQAPTNIPALSRTKQVCWFILILSSIPIHLLFNSAVYGTTYESIKWNTTIATSHFTHGGIEKQTYWLPGASLAISGSSSPVQREAKWPAAFNREGGRRSQILGFGSCIEDGFWGPRNSEVQQEIAATARTSAHWTKLTPQDCMDEFRPPKLHTAFRNLVIVVQPGKSEENGWKRTQVFEFNSDTNLADIWDSRVPPDGVNSLWFWTQCEISDENNFNDYYGDAVDSWSNEEGRVVSEQLKAYTHSCGRIFGLNTSQPLYRAANVTDAASLSFINDGQGGETTKEEISSGFIAHPGARDLQIDYCLAEPSTCQLRVSNILILIVMICVLIKVSTCIFLLEALEDASLVTPGDAIVSFITKPDLVTKGLGTLTLSGAQDLECQPRKICATIINPEFTLVIQPRRWEVKPHRLHSSVFRDIWVQTYYPIFLALAVNIVGLIFSGNYGFRSFGESDYRNILNIPGLKLSYLGNLLFVNTPQVILSVLYLTINALYTQLQVEQEWNSFSRQSRPLRVSYPTGKQVSTYRLQLPYKYSIPLIAMSILLHWLMANALFLFVMEGGGVSKYMPSTRPGLAKSMGVSADASIAIGCSALSLLIFFCVSTAVAISPFLFRYRKLKGDMVVGGTNSLVLSAACHVPRLSNAPRDRNDETAETRSCLESGSSDEDNQEYLAEVARGNVRWGAMPLPPDLAEKMEVNNEPVMHLGFGTEEHGVQAPQTGVLYA